MNALKRAWQQIAHYPSAVGGLFIILVLIGIAIYTLITIPYSEAIRLWRGGEEIWGEYPKNAHPVWSDWFTRDRLPRSILFDSAKGMGSKEVESTSAGKRVKITFTFDYPYDRFPQELVLTLAGQFQSKRPHAVIKWITPDGREIRIGDVSVRTVETYRPGQDNRLTRRLGGQPAEIGLFAPAEGGATRPLKGTYQMVIEADLFEESSDIEAKLIVHGQVHGIAGTDHRRRDLTVALLWGTPVALAFGLLAALGSTITTMIIAAVGAWFGGWVDSLIQRITEVNMVLPFLPILIMIGTLYTRSIWVILSVVIVLSIFGSAIKTYRAVFLQVKESPYIEAARAYGASSPRLIFFYMIPRIVPMLIPQLVVLIPSYVFLEASLAILGLGDPVLPTWGKVIDEARAQGALFQGYYYWMLEPFFMLMLTGLGFATLGFALDRIFNPRLRGL